MLWVERDLSAVCKAVFENWEKKKQILNHQYLFASSVRMSYNELVAMIQEGELFGVVLSLADCGSDRETYKVRTGADVRE
jgi:hypothetical protein